MGWDAALVLPAQGRIDGAEPNAIACNGGTSAVNLAPGTYTFEFALIGA
jgi:hypothetical protein